MKTFKITLDTKRYYDSIEAATFSIVNPNGGEVTISKIRKNRFPSKHQILLHRIFDNASKKIENAITREEGLMIVEMGKMSTMNPTKFYKFYSEQKVWI